MVLFIPAIYGSNHTDLYYNLDRSLPQDLDSIVALNKMKKDYDMASTHFIVVKDDLSKQSINGMVDELENVDGVNNVLSVNSATRLTLPASILPDKLNDNFMKNGYQMLMLNSNIKEHRLRLKSK